MMFKFKKNKGFVLLFAVTLSAILLAIALGVSDIALKELNFSTSARNTDDAFFASDTGVECALANDKNGGTSFVAACGSSCTVECLGGSSISVSGAYPSQSFIVSGLGSTGDGCAKVSIDKIGTYPSVQTTVISKGYNIGDSACDSTNLRRVERELKVTYGNLINVALEANGATASASSTYDSSYDPEFAINGDRAGNVWGVDGGWNDNTSGSFDDWLEVDFDATYDIKEIDVFGVQDAYSSPTTPTLGLTSSSYGLKDFDVEYWDGSGWQTVTGGSITNNNNVWVQLTGFTVSTSKVRVLVHSSQGANDWSRITEVEAWK